MFGEFEIWVLPHNLRVASERAASLLRGADFDILYLHVPRELGWLIEDLALGAPYGQFIEEVKRLNLLREPIASWEYKIKPLLLAIRGLKLRRPGLKIICYRSCFLENLSTRDAEDIAALVLRVNITGRIDLKEWLDALHRMMDRMLKSIDYETDHILRTWFEWGRGRKTICISDYSAKGLLRRIRESGIKASLRYIFTPYYFTPLEVLVREISRASERGATVNYERLKRLIFMHAEFVREYILTSGSYDEAYFRWLRDGRYGQYGY